MLLVFFTFVLTLFYSREYSYLSFFNDAPFLVTYVFLKYLYIPSCFKSQTSGQFLFLATSLFQSHTYFYFLSYEYLSYQLHTRTSFFSYASLFFRHVIKVEDIFPVLRNVLQLRRKTGSAGEPQQYWCISLLPGSNKVFRSISNFCCIFQIEKITQKLLCTFGLYWPAISTAK